MHYLIGIAGHPNVGDELITRTWLRQLAERDPGTDVWLDCPDPANAQALFAAEHPRLRCVDTLFRLCAEAPSGQPWDVAASVSSALDDHGQAPRWLAGLRLFAGAATVHLLGGGYVNSMWPRHLGLLAALRWAALRGARTALTGQGLAPLDADTVPLVQRLLEPVGLVDVRDAVSAELLGRPGSRSGDDLWMADLDTLVDSEGARDLDAVVCLQGDLLDVSDGWLTARCLEQLRCWDVDPERTAVVECIPRVDRAVYDRLRPLLPGLRFVPWIDVVDRGFPVAAHQRWFSSRFHPHMVAARAGARGVAVQVRPGYYDVKHASLLELGTGWDVLSVEPAGRSGRGGRGGPGRAAFERNVDRVRSRKAQIAEDLYGPAVRRGPARVPALPPTEGVAASPYPRRAAVDSLYS